MLSDLQMIDTSIAEPLQIVSVTQFEFRLRTPLGEMGESSALSIGNNPGDSLRLPNSRRSAIDCKMKRVEQTT
jgi:hypothetical protein